MDNNYAFLSDYLNRVAVESGKVDQQTSIDDDSNEFFNTIDEQDQQEEPGIQYGITDPNEEQQEAQQDMELQDEASDEDQNFMDAMFDTLDYEMAQNQDQMGEFADDFDQGSTTGPGSGIGGSTDPVSRAGQRIGGTESGGDYKATNKHSSATGKYQFLWGDWGDSIKKVTGVKSKQEFLNNPAAQDRYFSWYEKYYLKPEVKGLQPYNKQGLSEEQLMRLIHYRGAAGAKKYLQGKLKDKPESYNIPISEYIGKKQMGGYTPVARTPSEQYEGLNNPEHNEMMFPLYGENEFRGLDNGQPVFLQDETGKRKILRGRKDITNMKGKVFEKRLNK